MVGQDTRMDQVYMIYNADDFSSNTRNIRLAQCMRADVYPSNSVNQIDKLQQEELAISNKLFCSYCQCHFIDQSQQRHHYKLDWHRYNLKQALKAKKPVDESVFNQLADLDDVSSISGSESDTEEFEVDQIGNSKANALPALRHTKVFFENADNKIISIHRCLLHGKKDVPENESEFVSLALQLVTKSKWAILMLGGGHFAGGIFNGGEVLVHKTFHCYTVRKGQGGTQSSKDSRSGGSHPKSAGASLRRYNEAALTEHVQDIMCTWSGHLSECHLVFYRAPGQNKSVLFGGKSPPLVKSDVRLRTIPFPTRRATFSEVKRTQQLLASLQVYPGNADDYKVLYPHSPQKILLKSEDSNVVLGESVTEQPSLAGNEVMVDGVAKVDDVAKVDGEIGDRQSPGKKYQSDLEAVDSGSGDSESDLELYDMDFSSQTIDFRQDLLEFDDTVPRAMKFKKRRSKPKKEKVVAVEERKEVLELRKVLLKSVDVNNAELLGVSIRNESSTVTSDEVLSSLNEVTDKLGNCLLHHAAAKGHLDVVRLLLESGADPAKKNKKGQPPYVMSTNKECRNVFRRFVAEFPEKYDYVKAQIPSGLTDEMAQEQAEKKRATKKAKRAKVKEKKKEEAEKKEEIEEKERFLKLTDREKRALAADRRLLASSLASGGHAPVVARCFHCAADITGKVPFEYDIHRFCTIQCLKSHRMARK